jgi:ABC-type proline/glycine betaine transport system permease subunit
MTYEGVSLMVDLRLFIIIAMLLGLLGLGKSVLQAINFLSQKAEHIQI